METDTVEYKIQQATTKTNLKKSTFHITFNMNKPSSKIPDEIQRERLQRAVDCVFKPDSLKDLIKFDDPRHSFIKRYIADTKVEYVLEKGKVKGLNHVHLLLQIEHKSKIRIKLPEMKAKIGECLFPGEETGTNFHFKVQVVKNNDYSIRHYFNKDLNE